MKTQIADKVNGKWWRFSRYDMLNGSILPASDAVLIEYDPWDAFVQNVGRYRSVAQPYVELLELARVVQEMEKRGAGPSLGSGMHPRHDPPKIWGPQTEADELVLQWCKDHGLLGIVPAQFTEIRNAAQFHYRNGGQWLTLPCPRGDPGGKRVYGHAGGIPIDGNLAELSRFFPRAYFDQKGSVCSFAQPNSPEFWSTYGEPMQEFWTTCQDFYRAVNLISAGVRRVHPQEDDRVAFSQALAHLQTLSDGVGRTFARDKANRLTKEYWSAGLLASYALMFLQDVCDDRRALNCDRCGLVFVSDEHKAKFCSPQCRSAVQSQRYYQNRKVKGQVKKK